MQVRVESQLLGPENDHRVYLELRLPSLAPEVVVGKDFGAIWPLEFVRRLRNHLDAHLAAAEQAVSGGVGHALALRAQMHRPGLQQSARSGCAGVFRMSRYLD